MHSKLCGLLFGVMFFASGFLQAQETGFHVYENDSKIALPDSVQLKLSAQSDPPRVILLQWLFADGYLNASIDSIRQNRAYINRNCAFDLQEIQWRYSGERDTTITQNIGIRFTQQQLQRQIESRLYVLAVEGFPFARAEILRFNPQYEECSVSVYVNIETGEKAMATDIYFSGAKANDRRYLKKVSRFQTGELITPNYLRFLRSNLNAAELFNFVGEGQILLREGEPVIVFEVQERSLNQFDGLLGYVPDAAGNGQIVGDVELSLWNVLTQGNGINFHYQRLRPETSELEVGVSQDWIGEIPVGVSAGFQFYQNDTTYQSRDFELGGYYRISGGFKLTGGIGFQASTSGGNVPVIVEPDGRKRTARLGFEYTNLNRFDVPTSGNQLSVSYGIANKNLQEDSTGSFIQNTLHLEARQYIPIFDQSVIALSMQGFLLEADRVTINDLIRFGGANSFRGYAEEQFRAGQLLWGDVEYQFLLDRQSYLFVFGAVGRYHRPKLLTEINNQFQTTNTLTSTGFGLSYQTRIGRLKFTYAVSPEESIANGKVHFGIRTEL
ncbi:BamA/TamA family outer membrane protein [Gracilimonas tropica]|uniref:BamA/TamA family outer membrane protein n=1 Tax=Gracilimonas tropica TaxID=454600 RepID=UPI000372B186|nr:BamA/TamA family outer membrane protein [Gracilimonas tropica]